MSAISKVRRMCGLLHVDRTARSIEAHGPIHAPFNFNSAGVAQFSPEVTGRILLKSLCTRLGWLSLAEKRLLDIGCGVRFTQTLLNLEMPVARYFGVDVNAEAIRWLKDNVRDGRFRFAHLDMRNAMYNPAGSVCSIDALSFLGNEEFDAACMFSVITHQSPDDAALIFRMLRPYTRTLYFTALIDDSGPAYFDANPSAPLALSTYTEANIRQITAACGWQVTAVYPPSRFERTAFVCSAMRDDAAAAGETG